MRWLGDEADQFFIRGREMPDTIPVGAALFDETLQGAICLELVSALRTAPSLEIASDRASAAVRVWVQKHNAKRPHDMSWQRWGESGQSDLERLVQCVAATIA
jgi:hypothetical protein